MNLGDFLKFQPKQQVAAQALFNPECKYLLYGGAMAGGKSYFLRWSAILYLIYLYQKYGTKGIEIGLFSEDYPTLKDRQLSKIEKEVPKWVGVMKEDKIYGLNFELNSELGGGHILLRNLDDPSKYMSSEFAGIFVEELTRNTEETFQDLRNRLRYSGIPEPKFVGATNPGGVGHGWVKKLFVDRNSLDPEQDRFFYVHANAYDNEYIAPTYLRQLESLPPEKKKAYLEGSWDIFAGQFFPEFDRNRHVMSPIVPSPNYLHFASMDWGYTAPHCILFHILKKEKHDGVPFNRVITFKEYYGAQQTPDAVARKINKDVSRVKWMRCDPAMFHKVSDGSVAIVDQMRKNLDNGYTLKPANNDRIGGWALMHNWLSLAPDGLPYWLITENCKELIRTLPQQVYDDNNLEDINTEGEDHASDAARYGLVHIKWIDANVGGVGTSLKERKENPTAVMVDGKQLSIELDPFAKAFERSNRRAFYK